MRNTTLDFIKTTAIILMIATHANVLFDNSESFLVDRVTWLGATVCFTLFIFSSAAALTIGIQRKTLTLNDTVRRSLKLIMIYYILAFFVYIARNETFNDIPYVSLLIFDRMPIFTEFLITFVLLTIFVLIFQNKIKVWFSKFLPAFAIGIVAYALSRLMYTIDLQLFGANLIKSLFVGHSDWHKFGLLSYFLPVSLGFYYGLNHENLKLNHKLISRLSFAAFVLLYVLDQTGTLIWGRWPPSIIFLLYGIVVIAFIIGISPYLSKMPRIRDFSIWMSKAVFDFFYFHIFLIFIIYHLLGGESYTNSYVAFLFMVGAVILCSLAVWGKQILGRKFVKSEEN